MYCRDGQQRRVRQPPLRAQPYLDMGEVVRSEDIELSYIIRDRDICAYQSP